MEVLCTLLACPRNWLTFINKNRGLDFTAPSTQEELDPDTPIVVVLHGMLVVQRLIISIFELGGRSDWRYSSLGLQMTATAS
jgi:hypothetical protein